MKYTAQNTMQSSDFFYLIFILLFHPPPRWVSLRAVVTCSRWQIRSYQEQWAIPDKIQTGDGGWGHSFSKGTKERTCGNFKGHLRKKWNFQGCSRKSYMQFTWVLVFDLGISTKRCHTISKNPQGSESLFFKGEPTNLKSLGVFFQESIYI